MKKYHSEERAYVRVRVLNKYGLWPGVVRMHDDDGDYWILSYDPDVYELAT